MSGVLISLHSFPFLHLPETGTGSLTSRLTSDSTLLGSILTTNVNVAVQSSINLLGSVAYLFVLDVRLAAAYLSIVMLFFGATRAFGAFAKRLQMRVKGTCGCWAGGG